MKTKILFLISFLLTSFFTIAQTVELTGNNGGTTKAWDDSKYKNCKAWQAAVDNGTYEAPRGYRDIKCYESSVAGGGVTLSGTSSINSQSVKLDKRKIKVSETVELTGSNGGTTKAWNDIRYANCDAWQKAVDNKTYEAPRGYTVYKCYETGVPGDGVTLSGVPSIKNKKMNKNKINKKIRKRN